MPNSTLTPKENIKELNRLLFDINTTASTHPARGKDIQIIDYVKQIQTGPLYHLQKQIENGKQAE